jgi:signal transduction histidine kinase
LSIAAHELKTPVTAIKLAAELLTRAGRSGQDPPQVARLMEALDAGAARLVRLIDDLLDVARLQTGQLQVRAQDVDLLQLVAEATESYRSRLSPGHELVVEDIESPCLVSGDPDRLQQVLANLIDNAVKYSPLGGSIRVSVRHAEDGYLIQVKDQGIGVPAGSEESIFAPFGRAPNVAQSAIPGMGLGLYICRQIIGSHGGRIWASSGQVEQGSEMNVWLPKAGAAKEITGSAQ